MGALLFSLLLPARHSVHHHADCWNHSGEHYFLKIPPQGSPAAQYKDGGYAAASAIELYKNHTWSSSVWLLVKTIADFLALPHAVLHIHCIWYLAVWGVKPVVAHQTSWLESTGYTFDKTEALCVIMSLRMLILIICNAFWTACSVKTAYKLTRVV